MSLSQKASLQLAPLIARIILATIVLPAGYVSIFRTSNFTSEDAARIEAMGTPVKMIENSVEKIKPVAWSVNNSGDNDKDESDTSSAGGHSMRNLNHFILRLDDSKVPQPLIVGWICAIAELVGGIVLLVGLFTRWFALLIFIAALLYSSVGHAGASAYLAAMALMGVAPAVMKPTALALNILVAVVAFTKFYRSGAFSWTLL